MVVGGGGAGGTRRDGRPSNGCWATYPMGLLPDTYNCVLRMRRECRDRVSRHRGLAIPTCIMTLA